MLYPRLTKRPQYVKFLPHNGIFHLIVGSCQLPLKIQKKGNNLCNENVCLDFPAEQQSFLYATPSLLARFL